MISETVPNRYFKIETETETETEPKKNIVIMMQPISLNLQT